MIIHTAMLTDIRTVIHIMRHILTHMTMILRIANTTMKKIIRMLIHMNTRMITSIHIITTTHMGIIRLTRNMPTKHSIMDTIIIYAPLIFTYSLMR